MDGIFQHGEGDVGQRTNRDQSNFVRRSVHHLDDEVGAEAAINFAFAGRQFHVG